jgi:phosphinothricin acetyltransferase
MKIQFTDVLESDYEFIKEVYDHYILHSTSTYYTESIPMDELRAMILAGHPKYRSYLIKSDGENCGFCYLSQYKKRQAYDRSAEVSLYLKPGFTGKGIGKLALAHLEEMAGQQGISVLIGIISGDNEMSIKLFEDCGYEKCGHLKQVGEKFNKVLDVVTYEKILKMG